MGHEPRLAAQRAWGAGLGSGRAESVVPQTWILISLDDQGRLVRVWHQHGEGTAPVRLVPDTVNSGVAPSISAQAWECEECEALTVVSRPVPGQA